jgi:hypothetical protein
MVFFNDFVKPNASYLEKRGPVSTMCTECQLKLSTELVHEHRQNSRKGLSDDATISTPARITSELSTDFPKDIAEFPTSPHGLKGTLNSSRRNLDDDACKSDRGDPASPLYTVAKDISWSHMNIFIDLMSYDNAESITKEISRPAVSQKKKSVPAGSMTTTTSEPTPLRRKALLPRVPTAKNLLHPKNVPNSDRLEPRRSSLGNILLNKAASVRGFWKKTDLPPSVPVVVSSKAVSTKATSLPRSHSFRAKRTAHGHLKKQQSEMILSAPAPAPAPAVEPSSYQRRQILINQKTN